MISFDIIRISLVMNLCFQASGIRKFQLNITKMFILLAKQSSKDR